MTKGLSQTSMSISMGRLNYPQVDSKDLSLWVGVEKRGSSIPISIEILALQLLKVLEIEESGEVEVWVAELLKLEEDREKDHGAMINR